jgi:hypothetical protein
VALSLPGNSIGGLFDRRGSGSSSEKGGPIHTCTFRSLSNNNARCSGRRPNLSAGTTSTLLEAPRKTAHG